MRESANRPKFAAVFLTLTAIAGCGGGDTKPPEPPQRERAFAAESDAAKRYQRGEFEGALRQFTEAERLFTTIDDTEGIARNRRHLARSALHLGRPAEALARLAGITENDLDTALDTALDTTLLRAQAHLGLVQLSEATATLQAANARCQSPCAQSVALQLLWARLALANKRPEDAARHARSALAFLAGNKDKDKDKASDDGREAANAQRLLAEALRDSGDLAAAETAAQHALTLDRSLALPEKIARDWLLLGYIRQKVDAQSTPKSVPSSAPSPAARQAFQQARDIALAAGLRDILTAAEAGLAASSP